MSDQKEDLSLLSTEEIRARIRRLEEETAQPGAPWDQAKHNELMALRRAFAKRGRPVKRNMQIKVTESQHERVHEAAEADGVPVPEYMRRIIDLHFMRDEMDKQILARLLALENRISYIELHAVGMPAAGAKK